MNPRAATFRDEFNQVIGTTWGGTICWSPHKPSTYAATDPKSDRALMLRCRNCEGCREYERRQLCQRLHDYFKDYSGEIWITVIECDPRDAAWIAHQVRRATASRYEAAMVRVGAGAIGLIARGTRPRLKLPGKIAHLRTYSERLKRSRKRRAWSKLSAGLLVPRSDYGEQVKRWYFKGLPPAPKEQWQIVTRKGISKLYSKMPAGLRSYAQGIGLYAPEAWKPPKLLRRKGPEARRWARGSGQFASISDLLSRLFEPAGKPASPINRSAAEPRASSLSGQDVQATSANPSSNGPGGVEPGLAKRRTLPAPPFLRTKREFSPSESYSSSERASDAEFRAILSKWMSRGRGG